MGTGQKKKKSCLCFSKVSKLSLLVQSGKVSSLIEMGGQEKGKAMEEFKEKEQWF